MSMTKILFTSLLAISSSAFGVNKCLEAIKKEQLLVLAPSLLAIEQKLDLLTSPEIQGDLKLNFKTPAIARIVENKLKEIFANDGPPLLNSFAVRGASPHQLDSELFIFFLRTTSLPAVTELLKEYAEGFEIKTASFYGSSSIVKFNGMQRYQKPHLIMDPYHITAESKMKGIEIRILKTTENAIPSDVSFNEVKAAGEAGLEIALASFLQEPQYSHLKIKSGLIRVKAISDYGNLAERNDYKNGKFLFEFNILTEEGDTYSLDSAFVDKNLLDGKFSIVKLK